MPARKAATKTQRIIEFVGLQGRVDEDAKAILDVAVLGSVSANGREYTPAALSDAAKVFEGTRVFLNHRNGDAPHMVQSYVGRLTGLRADDKKVRADRLQVLNAEHWPLLSIVASDPQAFGLSIDGQGRMEGKKVVAMTEAHSVDIVPTPATNVGMFEADLREPDIGNAPPKGGSKVQALLFDKERFTPAQAKKWAKAHGFKATGIETPEGGKYHRIRQLDPGGFKRMRTKQLAPGIMSVIGVPK